MSWLNEERSRKQGGNDEGCEVNPYNVKKRGDKRIALAKGMRVGQQTLSQTGFQLYARQGIISLVQLQEKGQTRNDVRSACAACN